MWSRVQIQIAVRFLFVHSFRYNYEAKYPHFNRESLLRLEYNSTNTKIFYRRRFFDYKKVIQIEGGSIEYSGTSSFRKISIFRNGFITSRKRSSISSWCSSSLCSSPSQERARSYDIVSVRPLFISSNKIPPRCSSSNCLYLMASFARNVTNNIAFTSHSHE